MNKKVLVEATLSNTFGECWNNDYANQVRDHVFGCFRANGNGEYSVFKN